MAYNVLIVEDQIMPRRLLELYIGDCAEYRLAGSVSSADMAIKFCENGEIDLILMDILTEFGANGLDASEQIKKLFPETKIIIITSMPEASWLKRAREIGVDSFCFKELCGENIISVMDKTMAGENIFPDTVPKIEIGCTNSHDFTERELEVLRELLTGDSNAQIAKRLNITPETVKFHITQMLQKTGFRSRTELAAEAREKGIAIK